MSAVTGVGMKEFFKAVDDAAEEYRTFVLVCLSLEKSKFFVAVVCTNQRLTDY